jgi:broad specificity phosphatase PhoE
MKGGMFFKDNPYKTCDNNKIDWRKTWKSQKQYALYNSSFLYPGGMNWRNAVPIQNRLLDESDKPRICPESPSKSCEQNKQDWQEYWYPEYRQYVPHMLYPSDKNLKPIPYGIQPPDGKSCDLRFKEVEKQPIAPSITKHQALEMEQRKREDRKLKEKFDKLRKLQIIQSQLQYNEQIFIKIILAHLLHSSDYTELLELEKHYAFTIPKEPPKLYVDEFSKLCDLNTIISVIGRGPYNKILQDLINSPVSIFIGKINLNNGAMKGLKEIKREFLNTGKEENYNQIKKYLLSSYKLYLGNLTIEQVEYYIGSSEFERLLYPFNIYNAESKITSYQKTLTHQKETSKETRKKLLENMSSRQTRKLFSLNEDEEIEENEEKQEEISCIIVSHNTRIQCLLDAIQQNDKDKIRFMNCAILKLTITPNQLYISMVYQGNLSEVELRKINVNRPYYVKELSNPIPGHVVYPSYSIDTYEYLKLPKIDKQYTFYIVRHGQAQHNDSSNIFANKMHMITDTSITSEGIEQAKLAGHQLYEYLTTNAQTIPTHFFVSDLVRTHETLHVLLHNVRSDSQSPLLITPTTPIVLPCASELTNKGTKGNCDQITGESAIFNKLASENYSKCSVNSDGSLDVKCNTSLDWKSIYLPFYGNKVRSQKDTVSGYVETKMYPLEKNNCRNTNMIALAIEYLSKEKSFKPQSIGGKRSRKKKRYSLHSL